MSSVNVVERCVASCGGPSGKLISVERLELGNNAVDWPG